MFILILFLLLFLNEEQLLPAQCECDNLPCGAEKHPTAKSFQWIKTTYPLLSVFWLDSIKVWQLKSSQLKSYFTTEHEALPNGYRVISSSEIDLQGHSSLSNLQENLKLMHILKMPVCASQLPNMSKTSIQWTYLFNIVLYSDINRSID